MQQEFKSRDLVKSALEFKECNVIPTERDDVLIIRSNYGAGRSKGVWGEIGERYDEWGCMWQTSEKGVTGEVKNGPFHQGLEGIKDYQAPFDILEEANFEHVNSECHNTDKFTITMWDTAYNIFERMQHLRSTENLLMDIAYKDEELYILRDMCHKFFMEQAKYWCTTDIDALHIADDWGTQISLLISPSDWRSIFKDCYREYVEYCHSFGKKVLMHSDGNIESILDDLIEIGVDAINSQLFCMNIEELAEKYKGKICFWGEIDRQFILPFGTTKDCEIAVQRVADAFLKNKRTGIVGQAYIGNDIPLTNHNAVYDKWKTI